MGVKGLFRWLESQPAGIPGSGTEVDVQASVGSGVDGQPIAAVVDGFGGLFCALRQWIAAQRSAAAVRTMLLYPTPARVGALAVDFDAQLRAAGLQPKWVWDMQDVSDDGFEAHRVLRESRSAERVKIIMECLQRDNSPDNRMIELIGPLVLRTMQTYLSAAGADMQYVVGEADSTIATLGRSAGSIVLTSDSDFLLTAGLTVVNLRSVRFDAVTGRLHGSLYTSDVVCRRLGLTTAEEVALFSILAGNDDTVAVDDTDLRYVVPRKLGIPSQQRRKSPVDSLVNWFANEIPNERAKRVQELLSERREKSALQFERLLEKARIRYSNEAPASGPLNDVDIAVLAGQAPSNLRALIFQRYCLIQPCLEDQSVPGGCPAAALVVPLVQVVEAAGRERWPHLTAVHTAPAYVRIAKQEALGIAEFSAESVPPLNASLRAGVAHFVRGTDRSLEAMWSTVGCELLASFTHVFPQVHSDLLSLMCPRLSELAVMYFVAASTEHADPLSVREMAAFALALGAQTMGIESHDACSAAVSEWGTAASLRFLSLVQRYLLVVGNYADILDALGLDHEANAQKMIEKCISGELLSWALAAVAECSRDEAGDEDELVTLIHDASKKMAGPMEDSLQMAALEAAERILQPWSFGSPTWVIPLCTTRAIHKVTEGENPVAKHEPTRDHSIMITATPPATASTATISSPMEEAPLPIAIHCDQIVEAAANHPVILVQGDTGSGKSTKVPQYLVRQCVAKKRRGLVVVAQPRRLAAVALANRVKHEMRHESAKYSVSYSIGGERSEQAASSPGQVRYVTYGWLLVKLLHSARTLQQVDYFILDEVHDRTMDADILLRIFRAALAQRIIPGHLVLMSATMDGSLLSNYFGEFGTPPVLQVGQKRYPVAVYYATGSKATVANYFGASSEMHRSAASLAGPLRTFAKSQLDSQKKLCLAILQALHARMDDEMAGFTVLVFLSGLNEIEEMVEAVEEEQKPLRRAQLAMLHSSLPMDEQTTVFSPVPCGSFRVVFATNIAESSVTLPNVRFVIDFGMVRRISYVRARHTSMLATEVVSIAEAEQRAGRSGRESPGVVFRLYSADAYQAMQRFAPAEMERCSLAKLLLELKSKHEVIVADQEEVPSNSKPTAAHFLQELFEDPYMCLAGTVQPPAPENIRCAFGELLAAQCLEMHTKSEDAHGAEALRNAELTELGRFMTMLPMDIELGRLVAIGAMLGGKFLACSVIMASYLAVDDIFVRFTPVAFNPDSDWTKTESLFLGCQRGRRILFHATLSEAIGAIDLVGRWIQNEHQAARYLHTMSVHMGRFKMLIAQLRMVSERLLDSAGEIAELNMSGQRHHHMDGKSSPLKLSKTDVEVCRLMLAWWLMPTPVKLLQCSVQMSPLPKMGATGIGIEPRNAVGLKLPKALHGKESLAAALTRSAPVTFCNVIDVEGKEKALSDVVMTFQPDQPEDFMPCLDPRFSFHPLPLEFFLSIFRRGKCQLKSVDRDILGKDELACLHSPKVYASLKITPVPLKGRIFTTLKAEVPTPLVPVGKIGSKEFLAGLACSNMYLAAGKESSVTCIASQIAFFPSDGRMLALCAALFCGQSFAYGAANNAGLYSSILVHGQSFCLAPPMPASEWIRVAMEASCAIARLPMDGRPIPGLLDSLRTLVSCTMPEAVVDPAALKRVLEELKGCPDSARPRDTGRRVIRTMKHTPNTPLPLEQALHPKNIVPAPLEKQQQGLQKVPTQQKQKQKQKQKEKQKQKQNPKQNPKQNKQKKTESKNLEIQQQQEEKNSKKTQKKKQIIQKNRRRGNRQARNQEKMQAQSLDM